MFSVFNIICTKLCGRIVVFHKSEFPWSESALRIALRIITGMGTEVSAILPANGKMLVVQIGYVIPE